MNGGAPLRPAGADRIGILPGYVDVAGERHETPERTREALAAALGSEPPAEAAPPPDPATCVTVDEILGGRRAFGLVVNLYAVRSRRNWGIGDLTDLAALAEWTGSLGGRFVAVSPLFSSRARGGAWAPYSPVTRLFRDVLYLDVEAVPGMSECASARELVGAPAFRRAIERLRGADRVDHGAVAALKLAALRALHGWRRAGARDRAAEAGTTMDGETLLGFATFQALDERFAARGLLGWREWPPAYRDASSPEVGAFRREHADEVDFHAWLQVELDRQLAETARRARAAGLTLGLAQDLPLGTVQGGHDTWAFPGLFAPGVSLGAPPDPLGPLGQDWSLPPVNPLRLRASGHAYWRRVLRAAFAHAGALRVDHALGLVRQFWIPEGRPASEGAYVTQPASELAAVLATESRRAKAVVIAEDLGTVPHGMTELLVRTGILSTRMLPFEREASGAFRESASYSDRALVLASSHDLPPLRGWWTGADLELRRRLGLIANDADLAEASGERDRARRALLHRLVADGLLSRDREPSAAELCAAVNAFLCRTPAPLVGVMLDDLTGETEPLNVPGVPPSRHASWTRRVRVAVEDLATDGFVQEAVEGLRERAG